MGCTRHLAALLATLVAAGCAHAPGRPAPLPEVVWPEAPAVSRLRLVAVLPDPSAPAPRRSFWRALLDIVAGRDRDSRHRDRLARPFGVAALEDGPAAVADPDLPGVLRFDSRGTASPVSCPGRAWSAPMAVSYGPDGSLWVADGGSGEIVRVGPDGKCAAIGAGSLERPTGVVVLVDRLLVVDPPRHQVVVLSVTGEVLARWGERGEGDGRLHFPTALALTSQGDVLVVDALNFRVARFSADGVWLGAFGATDEAGGGLERPKGVAVDGAGRIYVTDAQRDRVLLFSPEGRFESALGAPGPDPGRFTMPAGIAVRSGKLFVADSHNQRVQVFEILGGLP